MQSSNQVSCSSGTKHDILNTIERLTRQLFHIESLNSNDSSLNISYRTGVDLPSDRHLKPAPYAPIEKKRTNRKSKAIDTGVDDGIRPRIRIRRKEAAVPMEVLKPEAAARNLALESIRMINENDLPKDRVCYVCGDPKHYTDRCFKRHRQRDPICFHCGDSDHLARNCPTSIEQNTVKRHTLNNSNQNQHFGKSFVHDTRPVSDETERSNQVIFSDDMMASKHSLSKQNRIIPNHPIIAALNRDSQSQFARASSQNKLIGDEGVAFGGSTPSPPIPIRSREAFTDTSNCLVDSEIASSLTRPTGPDLHSILEGERLEEMEKLQEPITPEVLWGKRK
ncbi:hypothetical protein MMC25_007712 [Agyrium rufum]|nr:hypothetical protein [Agyrium rufum]